MESEKGATEMKSGKGREAFRTISEVAEQLDLPQHVLRFWESKFSQIKPLKRGGNRRYYRPDDVVLITAIKKLLHTEGYTIRGVQKLFKAQGVKPTIDLAVGDESGNASTNEAPAVSSTVLTEVSGTVAGRSGSAAVSKRELLAIVNRLKSIRASLD